jgi:aryl-alcohol dehydrogenase-like predicted oxidoreductase
MQAVENLALIADDLGVSLAQMSIAWFLKNPNVSTVITGASRVEQVRENMKAIDVVNKLDDEVMARIEAALEGFHEEFYKPLR